ncbi:MAG: hypothetical protein AAGC71_12430 [Pseudomonadota bacterium]
MISLFRSAHPIFVFIAVSSAAVALTFLAISVLKYCGQNFVSAAAVFVYLGYAVITDRALVSLAEPPQRNSRSLVIALLYVLVIGVHVIGGLLADELLTEPFSTAQTAGLASGWAIGFFGPLYIYWNGAKALVDRETGTDSSFSRYVGTLVLFMFMPIGILLIQSRLRCLSQATMAIAAKKPAAT